MPHLRLKQTAIHSTNPPSVQPTLLFLWYILQGIQPPPKIVLFSAHNVACNLTAAKPNLGLCYRLRASKDCARAQQGAGDRAPYRSSLVFGGAYRHQQDGDAWAPPRLRRLRTHRALFGKNRLQRWCLNRPAEDARCTTSLARRTKCGFCSANRRS